MIWAIYEADPLPNMIDVPYHGAENRGVKLISFQGAPESLSNCPTSDWIRSFFVLNKFARQSQNWARKMPQNPLIDGTTFIFGGREMLPRALELVATKAWEEIYPEKTKTKMITDDSQHFENVTFARMSKSHVTKTHVTWPKSQTLWERWNCIFNGCHMANSS